MVMGALSFAPLVTPRRNRGPVGYAEGGIVDVEDLPPPYRGASDNEDDVLAAVRVGGAPGGGALSALPDAAVSPPPSIDVGSGRPDAAPGALSVPPPPAARPQRAPSALEAYGAPAASDIEEAKARIRGGTDRLRAIADAQSQGPNLAGNPFLAYAHGAFSSPNRTFGGMLGGGLGNVQKVVGDDMTRRRAIEMDLAKTQLAEGRADLGDLNQQRRAAIQQQREAVQQAYQQQKQDLAERIAAARDERAQAALEMQGRRLDQQYQMTMAHLAQGQQRIDAMVQGQSLTPEVRNTMAMSALEQKIAALPENDPQRGVIQGQLDSLRGMIGNKNNDPVNRANAVVDRLQAERDRLTGAPPKSPDAPPAAGAPEATPMADNPGNAARVADLDQQIRVAKQRVANVAQSPEDRKYAVMAVEDYAKNILPAARKARDDIAQMDMVIKTADQAGTGPTAGIRQTLGGLLQSFGADGKLVDQANTLGQIQGLMAKASTGWASAFGGRVTNYDEKIIQQALGNAKSLPDVLKFTAGLRKSGALEETEYERFMAKWKQDTGSFSGGQGAWMEHQAGFTPLKMLKSGQPIFWHDYVAALKRQDPKMSDDEIRQRWNARGQ